MAQAWLPAIELGSPEPKILSRDLRWAYCCKQDSKFEDGRYRLPIAMGAKPEPKALGQDLHA
jgi:hypothetical protein